ncbi:MAG: putative bifunctional diguanylate cyclase/phosphodiesterase [Candidatus Brocadia sp.]
MKTNGRSVVPLTSTRSRVAQICSGMAACLGIIALLGWALDFQLLASICSNYIPMAPNTATAFVVLGITLFVLTRWPVNRISWWLAKAAVIFVLLLGLLTLIQYLTDIGLGIDQLLFVTTKTLGKVPMGYMSPITAVSFLLSGSSLLIDTSSPANGKYMKNIASSLATIVIFLGSIVLLGYLYRTPLLYGGTIIPMALTTAVAFVFLGTGLIFTIGPEYWPQCLVIGLSTRARLMRAFLPITVVIVIIMGWIYTVIVLQSKSNPALLSALFAILFMVVIGFIVSHTASIVGNAIDLAEAKRNLAEAQHRKLSQAVEHSPNTVIITDVHGNIEYVNPKFTQLTGYTPEEVIGQNPRFLKSGETPPEEYKRLWDTITSGGEWRGEFYNRKKNGECYWERASILPIRNAEGVVTHFLAVKEDITERKNFEMQLAHLADRDPLTNLFNRRRFRDELERWLSHALRYSINGALLFLDMDNFKYINDTLGHQAGDELLINLADTLRERLRETDIIARLGGDEFAVLLLQVDESHALSIAREIVKMVHRHTTMINGWPVSTTVSIGIALFPQHGTTSEALLKCADLAMYRAKEDGRNRVCIYAHEQKKAVEIYVNWEWRIREAIDRDGFVLFLQPIVDLHHHKGIVGYEALLRIIDENKELIYPYKFLDTAERSGLIYEIDRWVIHRAAELIAEMDRAGKNVWISVNLSSRAVTSTELLSVIKKALAATAINPSRLILEITESAVISNITKAQRFIDTIKDMGCGFSLDDFGVGFSSLNHLKHLPVDYLKIDGGFICNLPNDPADQHIVRAIVEVARGLSKRTVAEFVGCEKTVQLLTEYGVDFAQGYHIGRPRAMSEI